MKIIKMLVLVAIAFCGASAFATANVESLVVDSSAGGVTVTYTLDEDAVVTARFFAGGDWIDSRDVTLISGDLNKKVQATGAGETRSFTWRARKEAWPDEFRRNYSNARVELTTWALGAPPPYMVVEIGDYGVAPSEGVRYYASSNAVPGGITDDRYKTTHLLLFKVPARHVQWWMGSPTSEADRKNNESRHLVVLSDDYYIGVYPVTQAQSLRMFNTRCRDVNKFVNNVATKEENDFRPTCGFSYHSYRGNASSASTPITADSWLNRLNTKLGTSFDLPTEAQWEFACRAGATGAYAYGNYDNNRDYSWHQNNSDYGDGDGILTRPVGKGCNAWGLYDMCGNVWEVCRDYYAENYSFRDGVPVLDPLTTSGSRAVYRGGAYNAYAADTRSARRISYDVDTIEWGAGVRLSCPPVAH